MAYFQRLIWFAVGVLLAAVPMLSFAQSGYTVTAVTYSGSWGTSACGELSVNARSFLVGYWGATLAELKQRVQSAGMGDLACIYNGESRPIVFDSWVNSDGYGVSAQYRYAFWGSWPQLRIAMQVTSAQCETGERDAVTGKCFTCPEGRTWNGTTCESPCEAKAGNSYGTSNSWAMLDVDAVPSGAPTFCDGSCSVKGGKVECESTSAGGTTGDFVSLGSTCVVQGPFTYTGQDCGPAGSAPQLVGVDDVQKPWWDKGLDFKECSEQGGYWGNVGGIDACVRPQPGETFEKETSTGNETGTETETAADGTTTEKQTTTSTECKDGKCTTTTTTTTTTKGADGQQSGSPTTETKQQTTQEADFCKLNPQHAQCAGTETGGAFAGSCASGFTCSGDAVQCAIARAQHESSCALAVGDGVLGEFAAIQGFDGTAPGQGLDRKQVDVPTALDVAEIGGGSGLNDLTITVMGKAIEIPFSELNRFIQMLGYAIMMIAWVGAWRIISGAF